MTLAEAPTAVTTWHIDTAHSSADFSVRHMMVSTVKGGFGGVSGTVTIDETNPANSLVEAVVDVSSVNTQEANRDNHLRSPDFFDVTTHPTMTFKSTSVEAVDEERYKITGDLTIRGTTNQVVLDTTFEGRGQDMQGKERAGFTGTTTINRKDYGLNWNVALEAGGVLVSEKVKVDLNVQLIRQ